MAMTVQQIHPVAHLPLMLGVQTNGVSFLQTTKIIVLAGSYCHGHALPPRWLQACTPAARNGGAHDHYRIYHRLILRGR